MKETGNRGRARGVKINENRLCVLSLLYRTDGPTHRPNLPFDAPNLKRSTKMCRGRRIQRPARVGGGGGIVGEILSTIQPAH